MKKIFVFLLILATSCNLSVNRKNNPVDVEQAKKYSANFYDLVKEKKFTDAALCFANEISYKDGLEILTKVNNFIGDLDTAIFLNATSNVDVNEKSSNAQFTFNYKVVYAKDTAKEEMVIELAKDTLKITGYHPRVTVK